MNARPALDGLRVVEIGRAMAATYAGSLLGDLGADVVHVEPPEGYPQGWHSIVSEEADLAAADRSKRSVALDLSRARGSGALERLLDHADVLIVSARPGILRDLGLDAGSVRRARPRLVHATVTAYGLRGPRAEQPASELVVEALSGVMSLTGEPGRPPVRIGFPMAELTTALLTVIGVQAALRARRRDGTGDEIDVSLLDAQLAILSNFVPSLLEGGREMRRLGVGHPQIVPYQAFPTADRDLVLACLSDRFWPGVCRALEQPDWEHDPRFENNQRRIDHRDELVGLISRIVVTEGCDHWLGRLAREDVPCAPVNSLGEALDDPQVRHNGTVIRLPDGVEAVRTPLRLGRTPPRPGRRAIRSP